MRKYGKRILLIMVLMIFASCGKKERSFKPAPKPKIVSAIDEKVKKLTEAAQKGDVAAQTELGEMYLFGKEVPKDPKKALMWSTKAMKKGNEIATTNVGIIYFEGFGVKKDYKKASELFNRAMDRGNMNAEMKAPRYLGIMAEKGLGTKKNLEDAIFYYEMGGSAGDIVSQYNLAKIYESQNNYERAIELYKNAEGRKDADAAPMLVALGDLYKEGKGVAKNTKEARKWYEKAVEAGSSEAKLKLEKL